MVSIADAFAAWLVALLGDAARKRLTTLVLGSEQERALHQAATAAIQSTATKLDPSGREQAESLAMVVSEVFDQPNPGAPVARQATLLEALQVGIAETLAVLDDPNVTGTGQSSAEVLGVPGSVIAETLAGHLVREIMLRGSRGGPLAPLADQLNHDVTHLQGQRIEGMLAPLTDQVMILAQAGSAALASKPDGRIQAGGGPLVVGDVPREPQAFVSRRSLVAELREVPVGVSVVHAVTGLRGVGKTQVAAAYARSRIEEGWRLVAWVNAGDRAGVLSGLAKVAAALDVDKLGMAPENLGEAVRHRLEADGEQCLLVFDNAVDIDGLLPFLPAAGSAQIVLTSMRQAAANLGRSVPVGVFTEAEALAFLAERTGLDDEAGARTLAYEMGRLPLGLAQAAAVIARQRLSYGTYLDRLRAVRIDNYLERVEGDPYPYCVAEAVLLALEAAEAADPTGGGQTAMDMMAILSPSGVSRRILHTAADLRFLPRGRNSARGQEDASAHADAVIGHLSEWSLVTFSLDGSAISVHRLVMRVVRERRMADGTFARLASHVTDLLGHLSDAAREGIWEDPAAAWEIVEQIVALNDHTAGNLGAPPQTDVAKHVLLLRQRALWLANNLANDPALAISTGEPLVTDCMKTLGGDDPETLTACNNLATAYQGAGRLTEAIRLFKQTLADRRRVLGDDHAMTLTSRNNLAGAYREAGGLNEAIQLYEAALNGRERVLGPDDPETLATRSNLAGAYQDAGRLDEAIPLFERTVADSVRVLGNNHPRTLIARNNLAGAYYNAGCLDEAITFFEDVLTVRERILGDQHPHTIGTRINLAGAYHAAGREEKALRLLGRALADSVRALGDDHPMTLNARSNLAGIHQDAGRLDEAIPLYEAAFAGPLCQPEVRHPPLQ